MFLIHGSISPNLLKRWGRLCNATMAALNIAFTRSSDKTQRIEWAQGRLVLEVLAEND